MPGLGRPPARGTRSCELKLCSNYGGHLLTTGEAGSPIWMWVSARRRRPPTSSNLCQLLSVLGEKPVYDSEEPTEWNSQDVVESDRTEGRTGLHDGAGREGERPANQSARVTEIPVGRHEAEAAGGLES